MRTSGRAGSAGWDTQSGSVDGRSSRHALGRSALLDGEVVASNDGAETSALDVRLEVICRNGRVDRRSGRSRERARLGEQEDCVTVSAGTRGRERASVGSDIRARVDVERPGGGGTYRSKLVTGSLRLRSAQNSPVALTPLTSQ